MNNLRFGAELKIGGQESATATEVKVQELRASILELATSFDGGEISQQEFSAALKSLNAELRANEQASRILATARHEQATADRDAAEAAEMFLASQAAAAGTAASPIQHEAQTAAAVKSTAAERDLAVAMREVALANSDVNATLANDSAEHVKAAANRDLAASSELEAMAIQHEIEMLRFEQEALKTGAIQLGNYTIHTHGAASAHAKLDGAMTSSGRGMRNWGQSALIASQGLEDVQYGMGGLINNIPYLVMSLGGPMGIAAAVSVTTVAAYQLYKHWDQLANIFEDKVPFPKAANDLAGLNEQLDKTKKELAELAKLSSVTVTQANRVEQLRQAEKDIEEQVKIRKEIESLGAMKSTQEEEVAKAFKEAIGKSGGGESLKSIQALIGDRNHTWAKGFQTSEEIVQKILKGDKDAYDFLIHRLGEGIGRESGLFDQLRRLRPKTADEKLNEDLEKLYQEIDNEIAEAWKKSTKALTEQGAENQAAMIQDMGKDARKQVEDKFGGKLKDILVKTRAAGSTGAKEVQYLTSAIADELGRMMPELAKFPTAIATIAGELARTLQIEVDKAIDELMKLEGLTKREALRRLDQQRAEKGQEKTEALATDAFKQAAATEARRNAQLNPNAAPATPKGIAERAAEIQGQLKDLGVTPKQQVQIGNILNDPRAGRLVPGAMEAMGARGMGEGEAMRALPEFFRQLRGGQAGIERAADRIAQAAERAERAAFQRGALRATAVPRARPRARPKGALPIAPGKNALDPNARNLPNTALSMANQFPAQQKARDAERDRLIAAQKAKDAKRREASEAAAAGQPAPQANLAPAVAGTQQAMASTQAVQAANLAIVAALNLRVRTLESNARQMLARAAESGPTASPTGAPVA